MTPDERNAGPTMTSGSSRSRSDPRVERTRTRVLQTAADLMRTGGVRAVTIEAVVVASGVARSTIYRHWSSRAEVVSAALETLLPAATPGPGTATSDREGVHDRLVHALALFVGPARPEESAGLLPMLLVETDRDPELAGLREQLLRRVTGGVLDALRQAVATGELDADLDVVDAAAWLIGPVIMRRFVDPAGADAAFVHRTVASFLRANPGSS
jgi:TetR/AcrR family transcriptional regulator, regulator of autoinduction and epiphytic fitness